VAKVERVGECRRERASPTMHAGVGLYPLSTHPATTAIQPRRVTIGRHTGVTRVCRRGTSKIRRDRSVGALYKYHVRFAGFPRSEAR
jgi:hypothetical protein